MIKIKVFSSVAKAFALTFKNIPSIFGCALLWLLTFWIPYINVGTSIAMANLPIALSKGEVINPLSIFSPIYRKKIGDFIIFNFIAYGAIFAAMLYFVIPGIVLFIAWSMAQFIMIEMDKSPLEALKLSNNITYGNKWRIFAVKLLSLITLLVVGALFLQLLYVMDIEVLAIIGAVIVLGFLVGLSSSVDAIIWQQLKKSELLS